MAHRHKMHKKAGGRTVYAGGGSNVAKEAEEKKHGGRTHEAHMHHGKSHKRGDKRARGGGVGADRHPFSSAYRGSDETKGEHGPK